MKLFAFIWIILEFVVFFAVAHWLGLLSAILLIVVSLVAGSMLVKSRMDVLKQMQMNFMMGKAAGTDLMQNMAMLMAGFFLLVPGFISSILGLILLVPFWRFKVVTWLLRHGFVQRKAPPRPAANEADGRVIDGESWRDQ